MESYKADLERKELELNEKLNWSNKVYIFITFKYLL